MAILTGGPLGRLAGKVGDMVFGAARTRIGKQVTAREKVSPSNPQTAGQVLQRSIFKEALYAARHLTATLWQSDWNRSIGQLPGFQSFMSVLLNNTDSSEVLQVPAVTPLGNLHQPGSTLFNTGSGSSKEIDISFTPENGLNGTAADTIVCFAIQSDAEADFSRPAELFTISETRSDGAFTIECEKASESYVIGVYFHGAGTAAGLLSPCVWGDAVSKA